MRTVLRVLGGARRYWLYFLAGLLSVALSTLAGLYAPWALRELTDLATQGSADFTEQALRIGLLLLGFTALQAVGGALAGYLNHSAALRYVVDLRTCLYGKLQRLSLRYFNRSRTGDLTSRVVNDAMSAEVLLAHVIPDFLVNSLIFVGVGIILFIIDMKLALMGLVAIPFLLIVTLWQGRRLAPIWKQSLGVRGELSGTVQDNLAGIKEIQIFNRQEHEEFRVSALSSAHSRSYLKASLLFESTYPLLSFFTTLGIVTIIIFGGYLFTTGEVSIADIVAFVMYLGMFYDPIKNISRLMEMAGESVAGCKRVFEVIDEASDVKEASDAQTLSRAQGRIEFRDLSFSYDGRTPVLAHIDLTIHPNQTVALVGTTGAGKTTIVSLLNRFYDPQSGSVLVDGVDIRTVTLASLRDNISMVLQDTFLFNGTIYENIVYGWKDASPTQVLQAARAAHIHDFIMGLEHGYDTMIGERGVRLSGGQRQRVSIARAILRNAPILILDEATSALDTRTERDIQRALDEIARHRTTLVIAHRLSTIRHADMIVVLEGATIIEKGTHDELMRRGGVYARLHAGET